jgi:hypothetical protein
MSVENLYKLKSSLRNKKKTSESFSLYFKAMQWKCFNEKVRKVIYIVSPNPDTTLNDVVR